MQKYLPLGNELFPSLIKNSYYVDKTDFVKEILGVTDHTAFLFVRPRRFGKSLMLSMLDSFFSCSHPDPSLFKGLSIEKDEEAIGHFGKYNVIHLNFKNLGKPTYEKSLNALKALMKDAYSSKQEEGLLPSSGEDPYISSIIGETEDEVRLSNSLQKLSEYLHKANSLPVMVLIDEYDAPILEAYLRGHYDDSIAFFRDFLGCALKGNEHVCRAVITGVLQVAHSSIFSGLNNLVVDNGLQPGKEYFGFKEEEVESLLSYYGSHAPIGEMRRWYGNYRFSGEAVYSPWSVLSFLKGRGNFEPYWVNTGSTEILDKVFKEGATLSMVKTLMEGGRILFDINPTISFLDFDRPEALLGLLYFAGYLTSEPSEFSRHYIYIPNEEIRLTFKSSIYSQLVEESQYTTLDALRSAFLSADGEAIESYLEEYLLSSLSYFDFNSERSYQVMLLTLTALLFDKAVVESEANVGEGRCDISISLNGNSGPSFLIEVKRLGKKSNDKSLLASAKAALEQIHRGRYYEKARRHGNKPIYLYGASFAGKRCRIQSEVIQ